MTYRYLKKATLTSKSDSPETIRTVQTILDNIEAGGDIKALEYSTKYDRYYGPTILSRKDIELASSQVSEKLKTDLLFSRNNVRRFAEAQKSTISNF